MSSIAGIDDRFLENVPFNQRNFDSFSSEIGRRFPYESTREQHVFMGEQRAKVLLDVLVTLMACSMTDS